MSRTPADAAEDATSGDPSRPRSRSAHRWRARLAGAFFAILIVAVGIVLAALAAGYRPVVIQTGSMGDTAPPGSLIVAVPRQVSSIGVDDILVMRRPGATPVTHRIIEIEQSGAVPFAITQGDANESPDAAPYPLDGEQLVARWIAPGWGGRLETVFQPGASLTLMAVATAAIAFHALRRIWITPPPAPVAAEPVEPRAASPRGRRRQLPRRRLLAFVAFPLVGLMSAGVAFAMFVSGESVAANDFTTAACFDPQLSSVQNGESIHAVDGVVTVPITAVDPAGSFVMASVRSASNEPADATVQVVLRVDGAALELSRNTDAGAPPPVTVAWSVVEYGCGASVQRGTVVGNGTTQIDIPVASVNQAASFVLATSTAEPTATDFGGDDLFIAELTSATNLRLRATGAASFDAQRSFSWQVVSFADPADASVQTITGTLPAAAGSTTLTIPSPVDTETTFLLTSVNSTAAGADIGKRLVRATLTDSTTITIDRGIAGEALDIQIQVVALNDGTTVRHGTVDFTAGQPARTIAVDPVDVTRSSVVSTVAIPSLTGGGMTDHIADDIVGEASATFILTAADTLSVVRDASASNSSFAWQVIEWAGPQWWDPAYSFRQRIDVDTSSVAAPDGYTVHLDFDHAALVSAGLSRSDGTDVRVLRWDGSSWTELDRVLDDASTWNAVSTTIWFKTVEPIAADTTSTYWLYIGNSSPGAVANDPEAVYLLTESFDSGTLGDFEDRTGGTGWYQADPWTRRIPLTVSAALVPSTLTDVPLQIAVTDADLSASAQTDGSDFRFTAADGVTLLDHEIESWDSGTGALVAWVRVPSLSSSADTPLYLYYGAADAPAGEQIHSVWSSGFGAAWHLGRDPAGDTPQIDDATVANRDGLSAGSMTSGDLQPAQSGSGLVFDGVDDRAELGPLAIGALNTLTVEAWIKPAGFGGPASVIARGSGAPVLFDLLVDPIDGTTANVEAQLRIDGSVVSAFGGSIVTTGAWSHLAATYDGSALTVFIDGAPGTPVVAPGSVTQDPSAGTAIGAQPGGAAPFPGTIDEVRLSEVARSEAWLDTHFANLVTGGFLVAGAPQVGSWLPQAAWTLRKPISIDPTVADSDELDFPVLVELVDAELQAGARADGADVVFTATDGVTRLDHTIESYDGATGALSSWVRVPTLSASTTTEIFLYFANPTATDQQDPVGVFGSANDLTVTGAS